MENKVIQELNAVLEGHYMAVHGYEKYIQHAKDPEVKSELQEIQKDHKENAAKLAERIQNLGGVPVEGAGIKGVMADMMEKFKRSSDDLRFILKDAQESEEKGIKMTEEVVRGDLDDESRKLMEDILDKDRKHVDRLNKLIH